MDDQEQRSARSRTLFSAWSGILFATIIVGIWVSQMVRGTMLDGEWWELAGGAVAVVCAVALLGISTRDLTALRRKRRTPDEAVDAHHSAPDR